MSGFDVFGYMSRIGQVDEREIVVPGRVPSGRLGDFQPDRYVPLPNPTAPANRAFCALGYCFASGTEQGRVIRLEYGTPMVLADAAPDGTTHEGYAYFTLDDGATSGWIDRRQVRAVAATPIRGGDLVLIARATPGLPDAAAIPAEADYVVILVDQTARDVVGGRIVGYSVPAAPGLQPLRPPISIPPVSRGIILSIMGRGR